MVSSSGFSKPAQKKAAVNGVELRTFDEINLKDIETWCKIQFLEMRYKRYKIISLFVDLHEAPVPKKQLAALFSDNRKLYNSFKNKDDGKTIDLNSVFWTSLREKSESLFNSVPANFENKVYKKFFST